MRLISPIPRILLCALALLVGSTAHGQGFDPNKQIGSNDPHLNDGMVFALPTGEQMLYLTIVTHDDVQPNTRDAQVLAWFDQDPRLNKLKKQCHYNHYWHSHPHYAEPQGKGGMGRSFGIGYPCVAITRPNGEVLASAYYLNADGKRGKLPDKSSVLADMFWRKLDGQLTPESFQSHSSSPGNSTAAAASDCNPNNPDCRPNTPQPNSPTVPEQVDDSNPLLEAAKYFGTAMVILFAAVIVVLIILFQRDRQTAQRPAPKATAFFD